MCLDLGIQIHIASERLSIGLTNKLGGAYVTSYSCARVLVTLAMLTHNPIKNSTQKAKQYV